MAPRCAQLQAALTRRDLARTGRASDSDTLAGMAGSRLPRPAAIVHRGPQRDAEPEDRGPVRALATRRAQVMSHENDLWMTT